MPRSHLRSRAAMKTSARELGRSEGEGTVTPVSSPAGPSSEDVWDQPGDGKDSLPDGICAELSGSTATTASADQTWTSATTVSADPSWASASTDSFDEPEATYRGDEDFPSSPSPWDFKDDVGVPSSPSLWDPAEDLQGSGVHNLISWGFPGGEVMGLGAHLMLPAGYVVLPSEGLLPQQQFAFEGQLPLEPPFDQQQSMQQHFHETQWPIAPVAYCIEIPAATCACSDLADRQIIQGLSVSPKKHRELLLAAHRARGLLAGGGSRALRVELYGSLALCGSTSDSDGQWWQQDWVRHYVRPESDLDLVLLLSPTAEADTLVSRLLGRGKMELTSRAFVKKFGISQFALQGVCHQEVAKSTDKSWEPLSGARIDLTFIDQQAYFDQFLLRQEAFRQSFKLVRAQLEALYGLNGALAFDAYIFLIKAWVSQLPEEGAISSYQAICIGLFALQLQLYTLRCTEPSGLVLFECFLRFCCSYFSECSDIGSRKHLLSYRCCAIDISLGGRLLPRFNRKWRCEIYLLAAEVQMDIKLNSRMNIGHSILPEAVLAAAQKTLSCTLSLSSDGRLLQS